MSNEPVDHSEAIRAQVKAEIAQQDFGQDFGYDVNWQVAQTPQGPAIAWTLLITLRNPLLGQPRLGQFAQLLSPSAPTPEQVKSAVVQAVAELRKQADAVKHPPKAPMPPLALANGHGHR